MKTLVIFIMSFLTSASLMAQSNDVEMADTFRSEGKIYVVLAVILIILIGLFAYLIRIDRKISKLERDKKIEGK